MQIKIYNYTYFKFSDPEITWNITHTKFEFYRYGKFYTVGPKQGIDNTLLIDEAACLNWRNRIFLRSIGFDNEHKKH